ncbi:putative lipoprotein [Erwinia amylovora ATCC 49946]|nr:putative lipoprotein [Erwinia amylovora ATCC 49946]
MRHRKKGALMKKEAFGALALLLLAGCTSGKPGAYEKVDEDPAVNSVQYRFKPGQVDKTAMQKDVEQYCSERGFDKVDALNPQESHVPGLMKAWYQCNYRIKS